MSHITNALRSFAFFAGVTACWIAPVEGAPLTKCTSVQLCYCTNSDLAQVIADRVTQIRAEVRNQRSQGKTIGYISIPLSTAGGSYFGVNVDVSQAVQSALEKRFGSGLVGLLNPGLGKWSLPPGATGADYMYMWTQVLAGDDGLGADFEFFYFVGPTDFASALGLTGASDLQALEQYYDRRAASDPNLAKVEKRAFRNYYGLKASVAFSLGSHDEWNIAKAINERRRSANKATGITDQLGVLFDGRGAAPALLEGPVQAGDAGQCSP